MGEEKKTPSWVFSLTVKANSTERVCAWTPQNKPKETEETNTRGRRPNCPCKRQPECTCIGLGWQGANKRGFQWWGWGFTTTRYQTGPNTEHTKSSGDTDRAISAFRKISQDIKPLLRVSVTHLLFNFLIGVPKTREQQKQHEAPVLFSFLLLHLRLMALMSLVRKSPVFYVWVHVRVCVCLWSRSWLCVLMSRSHSKIFALFHLP